MIIMVGIITIPTILPTDMAEAVSTGESAWGSDTDGAWASPLDTDIPITEAITPLMGGATPTTDGAILTTVGAATIPTTVVPTGPVTTMVTTMVTGTEGMDMVDIIPRPTITVTEEWTAGTMQVIAGPPGLR